MTLLCLTSNGDLKVFREFQKEEARKFARSPQKIWPEKKIRQVKMNF